MIPQDGVQGQLILTDERLGAVVLVPILAKSKNFRDGYSKRDRLSVKMLIVFLHVLVLLTRRQRIEGKGEDFLCDPAKNKRDRSAQTFDREIRTLTKQV